jgi:large subunit ribosomal protein L30
MAEEKIEKKAAPKKAVSKKSSTKEVAVKKVPAKKVATKNATLSVTLIKSFYGRLPAHRATVNGLGLKRINHTVELQDTPEVRGMINKVSYLLKVEG